MSRGHDTRGRRERRHRDDRPSEPKGRDAYPTATRGGAYPQDYPSEYTPAPPAYDTEPEYGHQSSRRSGRGDHAPAHRRGGLNEDYYNVPGSDSHDSSSRRPDRRDPDRRSRRRSEDDRYGSRRHSKPAPELEDEDDYYQPQASKSRRRARTEPRGHGSRGRSSKRYDDAYTDEEPEYREYSEPEERPAKPSRRKSFLQAIGIGKADKQVRERGRGRSPSAERSLSRDGRRRNYSFSPSPTRRHRSAGGGKVRGRSAGGGLASGLKRSNTNWQRAAGSAVRAGATAAYELRHDPSPWVGPKGIRVATAALGAAVVDSFMEEKHPKKSGGMRHNAARQLSEAALRHIVSGGSDRGRSKRRY